MATNESIKTKSNFTKKLIIAEQIVLYTAIVAGASFYAGTQYNAKRVADTQAAIHAAVQAAATPAAVASVPKN